MPELPEVETMCRCIAPAVGCRIRAVERPKSRLQSIMISPRLDCFCRRLTGRTIEAVRRVGKRVVLELGGETADCVVLEPRMTGLVLLADPPDREHVRLIFRLSGGGPRQILFWDQRGLGVARLMSHADFLRCYGPDRLGPDALQIDCETLQARFSRSRRPVKVALLEQHLLAGVGNLYASEILHLSGIDPRMRCDRLRAADWAKVHAAMKDVLRKAIKHQGSTLRDGTYRIGHNRSGNFQLYHRVYHRAGELCLRCGVERIVRIVQAQRSTFFCPACQQHNS
jgi:formamidopyrimidine-DNA glycosylase